MAHAPIPSNFKPVMVSFKPASEVPSPGGALKRFWPPFLLFFALPVAVALWFMGAFNGPRVAQAQRGPYDYAYLALSGDYSNLLAKQDEVYRALQAQGITPGAPVALLLKDPRSTPKRDLFSRAGFLVEPGVRLREPLRRGRIPPRRVVLVTVKANPYLAPGKAYKALLDYLQAHNMKLTLPTFEIYREGVLTVEMDT